MTLGPLHSAATATAAIQLASVRTGVDFGYLLAQAKVESGLNPGAKAATGSARGLYQFTRATWLETIGKHGGEHGLGWAAAAVRDGSAARDPAVRAAILDLRGDATASSAMAASYASDNATKLEAGLGRTATATDLYMAHFLGSSGALRFLRAKAAGPDAAASSVTPAAARSNYAVFFAHDGGARSLGAVYDRFAVKFGGNPRAAGGDPATPGGTGLPVALAASPASDSARLAYLLLAELGA